MNELTKNKNCEPEILFNYIKELIQKTLVYKNETIEKLKTREISVEGTYDEILTTMESEIRSYIKVFDNLSKNSIHYTFSNRKIVN